MSRLIACCLCLLLAACQSGNPYRTATPVPPGPPGSVEAADYPAPPKDFSRYRNWRWQSLPTAHESLDSDEIRRIVSAELDQRGLRPAREGGDADLLVTVRLEREQRLYRERFDDYPGGYYDRGYPYHDDYRLRGYRPPVRAYSEEMTVVHLQLFDGVSGRLIWQGRGEAPAGQRRGAAEAARRATRQALADYPPH